MGPCFGEIASSLGRWSFPTSPETSRVLHEAVGRFLKTWWKIGENAIQDQLQLVQVFLSKTEDGSQDYYIKTVS